MPKTKANAKSTAKKAINPSFSEGVNRTILI
jgi:hypothetical protein